ncbi:hypothetical protein AWENTII_009517 [Aspergillus wentii]|nr:hypothetical protein MW887_001223 [Aspergillus wentii]
MVNLTIISGIAVTITLIAALIRVKKAFGISLDKSFARLEARLEKKDHPFWASKVRAVAKVRTVASRKKQKAWIREAEEAEKEEFAIVQRSIYLCERWDLFYQRSLNPGLTPEEQDLFDKIEKEYYEGIDGRSIKLSDTYSRLDRERPAGAWVREFEAMSYDRRWQHQIKECKARGGCCSRLCQCCSKARCGLGGQKGRVDCRAANIHCTPECGCCIRWKRDGETQMDEIQEKKRRDLEWEMNLSFV